MILDGLIQLGAFLSACVALFLLLRLIAKNNFETNFGRMISVVGALVVSRVYMMDAGWSENIVAVVAVLFALAFLLILQLLKTPLLVGCIAAMALVPLALFMEHAAKQFSAKVVPEGPTFAEYMGLAQEVIEEDRIATGFKLPEVDQGDVVRKELGVPAPVTVPDEAVVEAMQADFSRGLELLADRKIWMDGLTSEEKRAYREEMAAFLAEQGIAGDRYSLAAIKEANPTNLMVLASFFSELRNDEEEQEERVRSVPESLAAVAANLSGNPLSEEAAGMLQELTGLFDADEIDRAIGLARNELEESQGENELAGMVLAAMVQAGSGLPVDQLLLDEKDEGMFELETLKELASRHWKRTGQSAGELSVSWGAGEAAAESNVQETSIVEEPGVVEKEPFLRITTHLGVVLVPNDESEMHEWIAAAQSLRMKGYVSLGDQVVLLRNDGSMLRKGEDWTLAYMGYTYHFRIHTIMKGRVSMRANGREAMAP